MQVTAAQVKELRELTGAGMSNCKNALVEAEGNVTRAVEILREKGLSAAAKKAGRIAAEGLVKSSISADRKVGALVEVNSETDFVAKNDEFIDFVQNVADLSLSSVAEQLSDFLAEKWPGSDTTVQDELTSKIAKIGENLTIRRFERYIASENGHIVDYIHGGGRVGVMVELITPNFNESVYEAGRNVAMQIAAMSPQFVSSDEMSDEYKTKEREILTQAALNENADAEKPKPEQVIVKMVEGRLAKQFKEVCLLDQEYVRDGDFNVAGYLKSVGDVTVKRFVRFEKGEGIEKKEEDFAAEVAAAMNV